MSVANDLSGEHTEQLAVLYCDVHAPTGPASDSLMARWRANFLQAAQQLAAGYGGESATTEFGGSATLFTSTIDALLCARDLATLAGSDPGGPSLSGGLSAGDVTHGSRGVGGQPVLEAIALCQRALPCQVLVADPLKVVVSEDSAGVLSPSTPEPSPSSGPHRTAGSPRWSLRHRPTDAAKGRARHLGPAGHDIARDTISGPAPARAHGEWRPDLGRPAADAALRLVGRTETAEQPRPDANGLATPALRSVSHSQEPRTVPALETPPALSAPEEPTGRPRRSPDPDRLDPTARGSGAPSAPGRPPASEPLRLTVLGWIHLEAGEPSVPRAVLRGRQARSVVSMLALRQGPVRKDELAELLWPNNVPQHWEGAIRGIITKIRRFLDEAGLAGRDMLVAEGGYYELRLGPGVTIDRHEATTLLAAARAALAEGAAGDALSLVRQAVTTLTRRLMSGEDNPWFDQFRSELDHERMAALDLLARAELRSANFERAKQAASEALVLDPYRESTYRLLMETHAAAGSRGEALRTYERCRRVLAEDLGVGPAAQTQALYLDLLG
ncbi:MAG: BTAD domain-containing putative transcriptional regulator [Acidimicrobiales bacterium]